MDWTWEPKSPKLWRLTSCRTSVLWPVRQCKAQGHCSPGCRRSSRRIQTWMWQPRIHIFLPGAFFFSVLKTWRTEIERIHRLSSVIVWDPWRWEPNSPHCNRRFSRRCCHITLFAVLLQAQHRVLPGDVLGVENYWPTVCTAHDSSWVYFFPHLSYDIVPGYVCTVCFWEWFLGLSQMIHTHYTTCQLFRQW